MFLNKLLWVVGCAALFGMGAPEAVAQIADINSAINKAGRQRMLSQRMAKAYLQVGQEVDTARSKKILDTSISLFDQQLVELKNFAPTAETKDTYLRLERVWLGYKDLLVGAKPNKEAARRIMEINEEVLRIAHDGTVQLEKHAGTTQGRLVNVAGRQRMLSQRMAKFYQAIAWGVAPANGAAELQKARKEFIDGYRELEAATINTRPIREELELGRVQWEFFETALKGTGEKATLMQNMATTSERILEVMDNATGMYEKLQAKQ